MEDIQKRVSRVSYGLGELKQRQKARKHAVAGTKDRHLIPDRLDVVAASISAGRSVTAASIYAAKAQVSAALTRASAINSTIRGKQSSVGGAGASTSTRRERPEAFGESIRDSHGATQISFGGPKNSNSLHVAGASAAAGSVAVTYSWAQDVAARTARRRCAASQAAAIAGEPGPRDSESSASAANGGQHLMGMGHSSALSLLEASRAAGRRARTKMAASTAMEEARLLSQLRLSIAQAQAGPSPDREGGSMQNLNNAERRSGDGNLLGTANRQQEQRVEQGEHEAAARRSSHASRPSHEPWPSARVGVIDVTAHDGIGRRCSGSEACGVGYCQPWAHTRLAPKTFGLRDTSHLWHRDASHLDPALPTPAGTFPATVAAWCSTAEC